jgi:hypothetical protein
MRRRRLLLGAGAVVLLGAVGFVLYLRLNTPAPGVTPENFRWLRLGMSLAEAEDRLGGPGVECSAGGGSVKRWRGDRVIISLTIDEDERIEFGRLIDYQSKHPWEADSENMEEGTFLTRLRTWLPW